MTGPDGIRDLISRAQAGDPDALERVLGVVRPWLERGARPFADPDRPDESTADLAQAAWLRAWQGLSQFRGAGDDLQTMAMFQAWVEELVRNVGLNAARERRAHVRQPRGKIIRLGDSPAEGGEPAGHLDLAASGPSPSSLAAAGERDALIRQALSRLGDERDREIVRLRFVEGLSLRQVAERLGTNHETVRQRYHAALSFLERELEGLR
jgi:RNA polymerase sigma-70 factor, ECF subfamily